MGEQGWRVGGRSMTPGMQKLKKWLTTLANIYDNTSLYSVASTINYTTSNITNPAIAKADTGASSHFLMSQHKKSLYDISELSHGPLATLPDNSTIQASY